MFGTCHLLKKCECVKVATKKCKLQHIITIKFTHTYLGKQQN